MFFFTRSVHASDLMACANMTEQTDRQGNNQPQLCYLISTNVASTTTLQQLKLLGYVLFGSISSFRLTATRTIDLAFSAQTSKASSWKVTGGIASNVQTEVVLPKHTRTRHVLFSCGHRWLHRSLPLSPFSLVYRCTTGSTLHR